MDASNVNHLIGINEAIAGIGEHRGRVRRMTGEQGDHRRGADLRLLVRHVTGLGHAGRRLDRIAQHMHVLHLHRFEGQEVDVAPALVLSDHVGRSGDGAGALR